MMKMIVHIPQAEILEATFPNEGRARCILYITNLEKKLKKLYKLVGVRLANGNRALSLPVIGISSRKPPPPK